MLLLVLCSNVVVGTYGLRSVSAMLTFERALPLRDKSIASAEAGDFSELSSIDGVRASIVIQGSDSPIDKSGSPLAARLAGAPVQDEAESYLLVLPHVEDVISHTGKYEELWRQQWQRIEIALDSFANGTSRVEEFTDVDLSLVTLAAEIYGPSGFDPAQDAAPFTAI